MNYKFTLGVVAGMSTFALAVPLVAQISSAQSDSSSSVTPMMMGFRERPPLTQDDIQKIIDQDDALLSNVDAIAAVIKTATQAHRDGLAQAITITDETQRNDAVRAAFEAQRATIQDAFTTHPEWKGAMHFGFMKGPHHGRGPHPDKIAEKLGMTAEELKTALDSGKTLEQIAVEKGVDLPPRPPFPFMHRMDDDDDGPAN